LIQVEMAFVDLLGETLVSKAGNVATQDVLAGVKNVMIYFSAHWCPPCRGFTPQLAKAYKESSAAGKDTIVIFVSSDRDQAGFDEYYGEMPWHALPFDNSDLKGKLSQKFEVNGIPMLIVLDDKGELVSANGRAEYQKYLPAPAVASAPAGDSAPAEGSAFEELFGETLVSKEGNVATKGALAGKKNVMVYFSAHWCPPCRGFTPQLAKEYKASSAAGKDTMVVFVSSDRDQASFDEYYGEMPWHALPFDNRDVKEKLSTKFGVNGIPMLIVLDGKGQLVTANGRAEYQKFLGGSAPGDAEPAKGACCVIS
jgi:nucleoredoxin